MSRLSSFFARWQYGLLYRFSTPRWDTGLTPPEVRQLIEVEHFPAGRALDLGCGTGTNVVYLAQHGFDVTGIDFVPQAIQKARAKARGAKVMAELRVASVVEPLSLGAPFNLALDIGCFHNLEGDGRARYAANLAQWTRPGSTYLLYAFFPRVRGVRRFGVTPEAVKETFAPQFELISSTVDRNNPEQDSAWYRWERRGVNASERAE